MTEANQIDNSELEALKARADLMGIKYHPNTGLDKLKAKINAKLDSKGITSDSNLEVLDVKEYEKNRLEELKKKSGTLVRVRITCMNPMKKEWEGDIFSVGSSKLGTFKKYVPFNVEWHIPYIMYTTLKEKKCTVFHTVKDHLGNKIRKGKLVPEFAIEVLPNLSKDELKDLAKQQAMANSIDKE